MQSFVFKITSFCLNSFIHSFFFIFATNRMRFSICVYNSFLRFHFLLFLVFARPLPLTMSTHNKLCVFVILFLNIHFIRISLFSKIRDSIHIYIIIKIIRMSSRRNSKQLLIYYNIQQ